MRPPRLTIRAASFSALGAPEHSSTYCTPLPPVIRCDRRDGVFARHVDHLRRRRAACPSRAGARGCRSGSPAAAPSALATPTPISPIGPGPMTTTRLAGDDPAHHVEAVHRGPGRDDQCRLRVGHVVGDVDHRVDVVDGVFGEPAIGAEAVGAVALLAVAVIEARGVHAFAAALAAAAAGMHLDRDAVADLRTRRPSGRACTTVPMYSWPGVKPLLNGSSPSIIAGTPCLMISMSVAQTAIASIRTSTSAGPGSRHRLLDQRQLLRICRAPRPSSFVGIGYWLVRCARFIDEAPCGSVHADSSGRLADRARHRSDPGR